MRPPPKRSWCRPPREAWPLARVLSCLLKVGRTRPLEKPRCGPQAGKSGDPYSQNADSSPRAQCALGLGFEAKPKGKCGAPRALIACSVGRRVMIEGTWVPPLPHTASATVPG